MQLPVASIITSSAARRLLPKPSSAVRVMSTRPPCRSLPSSQKTTSPKVRWMSIPITRRICASCQSETTGAAGDTTTTDSRSRRNRPSRRGGQLLTRALGSSCGSACPHLRAPGASVPDSRTIRRDPGNRSRSSAPRSSYRLLTRSSISTARSSAGPRSSVSSPMTMPLSVSSARCCLNRMMNGPCSGRAT